MSSFHSARSFAYARLAVGIVAGAVGVIGAVASATAAEHQAPALAAPGDDGGTASPSTRARVTPSTPLIASATPKVKAPPYGKS